MNDEEEEDQPVEDNDEPFESGDAQEEEEEEEDEEEESNRDENDQEEGTIQEEKERQEGENKGDKQEGAGQIPGVPERRRPGRLPNKLKAQLAQKEAPIQTMSEAEKIYYSMESAKRFNNKLLANRLKLKDHMKQVKDISMSNNNFSRLKKQDLLKIFQSKLQAHLSQVVLSLCICTIAMETSTSP